MRSWSEPDDLARERALADAGHVRLRHADDLVEAVRADADARRGGRRDRVRRGDERIRAVVEVEKRALGALEEHPPPLAQRAVDEEGRVRDVRSQTLRIPLVPRRHLLERDRVALVDALEPDVLLGERHLDLLAQDLRVEQVLHADAQPRSLVRVRRADARSASSRSAARPSRRSLAWSMATCQGMIRCALPETSTRSVSRPRPSSSSSSSISTAGSMTQPAPITLVLPGDDAGRDLPDLVRLAAGDDRVARVRPALVAADDVRLLREQVDDLALALVSPLRADDHRGRHCRSVTYARGRVRALRRRPATEAGRRRTRTAVPYGEALRASPTARCPSPCS